MKNCLNCWHLWSLHTEAGCSARVYPGHSLTGEPCPCNNTPDSEEIQP